jgi:hypothetical protein
VPPRETLPIVIDVGTNNKEYLNDPFYFGLQQPRCRTAEYDELIEEVKAIL